MKNIIHVSYLPCKKACIENELIWSIPTKFFFVLRFELHLKPSKNEKHAISFNTMNEK